MKPTNEGIGDVGDRVTVLILICTSRWVEGFGLL